MLPRGTIGPTDERANSAHRRIKGGETEVAGSEVEFFVVGGIVRYVHLTVKAACFTISIEHHHAVVIEPWRSALEDGRHDDHAQLACGSCQS